MGPYNRPYNPTPLESSMMRTGLVCLEFRVKGSREDSALKLKVHWTYVNHGHAGEDLRNATLRDSEALESTRDSTE